MPSISIIVPVYQAEKYLSKCIESVLRQTFSDWELLLIDDGCRDSSPAICDRYAAQDDRINYLDYVEIVSAIDALGGERPPEREFSGDPYYESLRRA